ncbi:MAG: GGDEF domain-containing protein, partial [Myxococcales bacterium]|nr:GGDEF domain-containing protein [Myxococcales bacterium]
IDVDHFKRVNDTYGHAAGDEVLRVVAQTLAANIREVDRAFRIGGEEFVVLLVGTDLAGAKIAAERLRSAIAERPVATGAAGAGTVEVTASLGIAVSHEKMQPADLLAEADAALYLAKAGGRNRAVHAPDVRTGEVRAADAPAKNEPSE